MAAGCCSRRISWALVYSRYLRVLSCFICIMKRTLQITTWQTSKVYISHSQPKPKHMCNVTCGRKVSLMPRQRRDSHYQFRSDLSLQIGHRGATHRISRAVLLPGQAQAFRKQSDRINISSFNAKHTPMIVTN